jgi:alkylation response protein AidB-like acyl-CoA dehydrogenase
MAARAVDENYPNVRRIVSEAKRFTTEAAWDVVNNAMQVMGGIGYTDIFPVERILRDLRLASIWTGSNEVMAMIIANEWYREQLSQKPTELVRLPEEDAESAFAADEKIYE